MRSPRRGATWRASVAADVGDGLRQFLVLTLATSLLATTVALGSPGSVGAASEPSDSPARPAIATWIEAAFRDLARAATTAAEVDFPRPAAQGATDGADASAAERLRPAPGPGPFRMNLFRRGDFVHQQTEYWCVAASIQTMINIMEPGGPDRSRAFQRRLHFQARGLDQEDDGYWRRLMGEERWRKGHHGLGLTDWAELLNKRGFGPYRIARAKTRQGAIRKAARAIRVTGKPAGLVVWRGAHAWVMSGFKATADPAFSDDFRVQKVFIQDPWYPSVSTIWGASRPPNTAVPVAALAEDYLRYDRPGRRHPWRDGQYVLIIPTT